MRGRPSRARRTGGAAAPWPRVVQAVTSPMIPAPAGPRPVATGGAAGGAGRPARSAPASAHAHDELGQYLPGPREQQQSVGGAAHRRPNGEWSVPPVSHPTARAVACTTRPTALGADAQPVAVARLVEGGQQVDQPVPGAGDHRERQQAGDQRVVGEEQVQDGAGRGGEHERDHERQPAVETDGVAHQPTGAGPGAAEQGEDDQRHRPADEQRDAGQDHADLIGRRGLGRGQHGHGDQVRAGQRGDQPLDGHDPPCRHPQPGTRRPCVGAAGPGRRAPRRRPRPWPRRA